MYIINKLYIDTCIRNASKNYKDKIYDLYINCRLIKRGMEEYELSKALFIYNGYNGYIFQDLIYKSEIHLFVEL